MPAGPFKANPNDGTTYQRPGGKIASPQAWLFPMSMNTHKVLMLLELSSVGKKTKINWIDISGVQGANYRPDFARMNPIMTVPVLEIDDKVITDSIYICEYLRKNYPGPGDKEVDASDKSREMTYFINQVNDWDEVMYTYGNRSSSAESDLTNEMRLLRLRQGYAEVAALPDETVPTGGTLKDAYLHKMAGITYFASIVGDSEAMRAKKADKMKKAKADLRDMFLSAEALLNKHSPNGGCLMGSKPTSADAMFLACAHRVGSLYAPELTALHEEFPRCKAWHELMRKTPEAKSMLSQTLATFAPYALGHCFPCRMIAFKLGLLKDQALPPQAKEVIKNKVEEMKKLHGTA